jgi:hypothetical protein
MKNYSKPEVSILGTAKALVQDQSKSGSSPDSDGTGRQKQSPAYDTDE